MRRFSMMRREIVDVALAAGPVQPEFHQAAVVRCQFLQFRDVVAVILGGILISRLVAIPGGKIDTEFQTDLSRRL